MNAEQILERIESLRPLPANVREEVERIRSEIEAEKIAKGKLVAFAIHRDGEGETSEEVKGVPVGEALAVHKDDDWWKVSHRPTGCLILWARTRIDAVRRAKRIAEEYDAEHRFLSSDRDEVASIEGLHEFIMEVRK